MSANTWRAAYPHVAILCDDVALYPLRGSEGAAGFDLRARDEWALRAGSVHVIPTGVRVSMPSWCEGQVRPRSSISRRGLLVHVGTIDSDYRGEVGVIVQNLSGEDVVIERLERIAQIVFSPLAGLPLVQVDALDETERGERGFGSTGRS